ncbi:hypothetical protein ACWDE9_35090, partial [Streptomyces olivaceoviridis]
LRKAFEDGRNEPGAADFYYGECEMRRHDTTGTTKSERRLPWGCWLLSDYPAATGTLNGSRISLKTSTPDPALHGGWPKRMTWARVEKATCVAINSVVFRSSGQNLTTADTYIEMASRRLKPTLLALGALVIRGRTKQCPARGQQTESPTTTPDAGTPEGHQQPPGSPTWVRMRQGTADVHPLGGSPRGRGVRIVHELRQHRLPVVNDGTRWSRSR